MPKLSKNMMVSEFDDGYYYADELKKFASSIGIKGTSYLRKDQIENILRHYFKTGDIEPSPPRPNAASRMQDSERGLSMTLPIKHYVNDQQTKAFLYTQAEQANPDFVRRTGSLYWLNRWREDELREGNPITYGDLVRKFVQLNSSEANMPQIPSTKYNNFVSDYLSGQKGATRKDALLAWQQLKSLKIPKTYNAWKQYRMASGS